MFSASLKFCMSGKDQEFALSHEEISVCVNPFADALKLCLCSGVSSCLFVCVCVCECVWGGCLLCVCVCVGLLAVCVCVCVCVGLLAVCV